MIVFKKPRESLTTGNRVESSFQFFKINHGFGFQKVKITQIM